MKGGTGGAVVIHSQIGRDIYDICIWAIVSYTWVKVLGLLLTPLLCCMGGYAMEVGGRYSWHNLAGWQDSGGMKRRCRGGCGYPQSNWQGHL